MAGKVLSEASKDSADMNMTPMIDCVFQLIIFFMVCTEIKKSDEADIQLPRTRLTDPGAVPRNRVIVNCTWLPVDPLGATPRIQEQIQVRNRVLDGPGLQALLERLDREERVNSGASFSAGGTGNAGEGASRLFVKIRADARCEWSTVQAAQMACAQAKIFQVSYATERVDRSH